MGDKIGHAELQIGDTRIMLNDEFPDQGNLGPKARGGTPFGLIIYTDDVDTCVQEGDRRRRHREDAGRESVLGRPHGHADGSVRPQVEHRRPMSRTSRPSSSRSAWRAAEAAGRPRRSDLRRRACRNFSPEKMKVCGRPSMKSAKDARSGDQLSSPMRQRLSPIGISGVSVPSHSRPPRSTTRADPIHGLSLI